MPDSTLEGPRDETLNRKRQKRNAALIAIAGQAGLKVQGVVVDGVASVASSVFCSSIRTFCPCGKGACIGHMGYKKSHCCSPDFELKCCVDIPTTTVAAPVIVQVSKACDKEKEACECGWGNCLRKEGMAASTCCSTDYEFACCTTAPTTEATTATTTLLPEQKLEKACNDAAALCPCGWARCIKADGFKESLCCKENYQYKCCVDPEKSYKMVKKNTTEHILEQRAMNECKNTNFTCFCSGMDYQNAWAVHFTCCDTNYTCDCCRSFIESPTEQCTKTCEGGSYRTASKCIWEEGAPASGDGCCLENYRSVCKNPDQDTLVSYIYMESPCFSVPFFAVWVLRNPGSGNGTWDCLGPLDKCSHLVRKWMQPNAECGYEILEFGCDEWFWPKPVEPMQVKTECQSAMVNCPCGWGACVWQPGFSASGCCKEDYSFECCTKVLPPPGGFGITTATVPSQSTPTNSEIGAVRPSQRNVIAALFALTMLIVGHLALLLL